VRRLCAALLCLLGCAAPPTPAAPEASTRPSLDAAKPGPEGSLDVGMVPPDATAAPIDAAPPSADVAGSPRMDARPGPLPADAGSTDAGAPETGTPDADLADAGLADADLAALADFADRPEPPPPPPPAPGFTPLPPMPGGPRQEVAVAALGPALYVVGGLDGDERLLTRVEVFDTTTRRWQPGVDLPVPVSHANLAAVDGRLYLLGFLGRRFVPDGRGFVFDPATARWSPGPALPPGRVRGGAGVVVEGGRIYLLGGYAVRGVVFADVLDPATGTWSVLPDLPAGRDHPAAARIGGEVFVTGGTAGTPEEVLSTSWGLDGPVGVWRARGPLGVPRGVGASATLGDRLYVFGGEGLGPGAAPGGVYDAVEVYDPGTDAFTRLDPLPTPLRGLGAGAVGPAIYLFGGATALGTAPVETAWAFVP
jgi:hypothetical protein